MTAPSTGELIRPGPAGAWGLAPGFSRRVKKSRNETYAPRSFSASRGIAEYRSDSGPRISAPVQGHQAAMAGIIMRFPTWLRFAGLGNYHKAITFRGFNQNEYHYNTPPADWLQSYADGLFVFFYKNKSWLKTPEAIYVESPYFNPGKHQVFVTHSGYIVD